MNSKGEVVLLQLTDQGVVKHQKNVFLLLQRIQMIASELSLL